MQLINWLDGWLDYLFPVTLVGVLLWCVLGYWWTCQTNSPGLLDPKAALWRRALAVVTAGPIYWAFAAVWAFANRLRHD